MGEVGRGADFSEFSRKTVGVVMCICDGSGQYYL